MAMGSAHRSNGNINASNHYCDPLFKNLSGKAKTAKNRDNMRKLSLITANVFQDNTQYEKFCSMITEENPDIFLTMESDKNGNVSSIVLKRTIRTL